MREAQQDQSLSELFLDFFFQKISNATLEDSGPIVRDLKGVTKTITLPLGLSYDGINAHIVERQV